MEIDESWKKEVIEEKIGEVVREAKACPEKLVMILK